MKIYKTTDAYRDQGQILSSVVSNERRIILPLLGERAGVRASLFSGEERASNFTRAHRKMRRKQDGFVATVEFIALLAIMVLLVTANARALYHLHREVRALEQQQIKRLNVSETNSVAAVSFNVANADYK